MKRNQPQTDDDKTEDDTPILEWIAGGVGLALFATAMAILLASSFSAPQPPVITVRAEPAVAVPNGFRVEFDVVNSGDQTAAQVHVEAVLHSDGGIVEQHDVLVDFLPPHSSVRAGVILAHDPRPLDLALHAASYQHP